MPAALKIDWGAAKALFVAGVEPNKIAEEFGIDRDTVYKRAQRNNWEADRLKTAELVRTNPCAKLREASVSQGVQSTVNLLNDQRQRFLEAGGKVALITMEAGAKEAERLTANGASVEALSTNALLMKPAMDIGKPTFGLGDGTSVSVAVGVNILSELPAEEVIDV